MSKSDNKRHLLTRVFCAICSFTFLGAVSSLFLFGAEWVAMALVLSSFGGLATMSALSASGILDFLSTLVEVFFEGFMLVLRAIADLFSF